MSTPDLDTGAGLRAQYVNDGGSAAVFSQKVAAYAASRPDYPPKPFDALQSIGVLSADKIVADRVQSLPRRRMRPRWTPSVLVA
jgi:hypothetical protein